jgi:hypothetical protein
LRDRGEVGRIAALDGRGEDGDELVAARRVVDRDARVLLGEAVDHGLERGLLLAAPDRHDRDRAGDVPAGLGCGSVLARLVVAAAAAGADSRQQEDEEQGEQVQTVPH